ncbi:hypothetical protein [Paenibacillus sp. URB8-2]|uniref:hypothetical protein n=1 Tax=Paenibacillus sp. URB8-2 TaxID=2741301 RepID=UPI0015BD19EB|nr:hypothetical protein [Paenibacillus sp. URB8-2]BCG57619.1 hypothetical protein PUR_10440 [Paenibacillus sp. URB8-2]
MHASIQPVYTWSRDCIFSGKSQKAILLIEWRGTAQPITGRKKSHTVAARDIELQIWLEPHVNLTGLHGCRKADSGDRALLLPLGTIRAGQTKYIALDFDLEPRAAGRYEMLWLQWRYRQKTGERGCELPVQKLTLEYSRHTGCMDEVCSFYVEKHRELLMVEESIAEALSLSADGRQTEAREKLRRHADKLLLLAVRSGDTDLTREAESLYMQSERKTSPCLEENSPSQYASG